MLLQFLRHLNNPDNFLKKIENFYSDILKSNKSGLPYTFINIKFIDARLIAKRIASVYLNTAFGQTVFKSNTTLTLPLPY